MKSLIFSKHTIFPQVEINMKNTYGIYGKNWNHLLNHLNELEAFILNIRPFASGDNF